MKMIPYYGFKIALTPNDKSKRAALQFAKHDCIINDKSYHSILIIHSYSNSE